MLARQAQLQLLWDTHFGSNGGAPAASPTYASYTAGSSSKSGSPAGNGSYSSGQYTPRVQSRRSGAVQRETVTAAAYPPSAPSS